MYFLAKVVILSEAGSEGPAKKITEIYLVDGVSPTDVEVQISNEFKDSTLDYSIDSIVKTKIIKILQK